MTHLIEAWRVTGDIDNYEVDDVVFVNKEESDIFKWCSTEWMESEVKRSQRMKREDGYLIPLVGFSYDRKHKNYIGNVIFEKVENGQLIGKIVNITSSGMERIKELKYCTSVSNEKHEVISIELTEIW